MQIVLSNIYLFARTLFVICLINESVLADSFVIIGHNSLKTDQLTKSEVINIYMGRQRTIDGDTFVLPMDLTGASQDRERFYRLLTGKSISEINSYWARVIFSGNGAPPRPVVSYVEMVSVIEKNASAIGYIKEDQVDSRINVLFRLESL
jgi:ABC-type phosphate transport system substrate-binding protein